MEDVSQTGWFWALVWVVSLTVYTDTIGTIKEKLSDNPRTVKTSSLKTYLDAGQIQLIILFVVTCVCYGDTFLTNLNQWFS